MQDGIKKQILRSHGWWPTSTSLCIEITINTTFKKFLYFGRLTRRTPFRILANRHREDICLSEEIALARIEEALLRETNLYSRLRRSDLSAA